MPHGKLRRIHSHFRKADPAILKLLQRMKLEILAQEMDHARYFQKLCREIVSQQLAGKAAHAIHGRFVKLFPGGKVTPHKVLAIPEKKLRAIGMSWAKASYVRDLARKILQKDVDLKNLHALDDEAVVAELVKVKGIGRWTAEMFLIFTLGREDVFSRGDLGLRNGFERVYGRRRAASRKSVERIVARWSPYRSYGSLALWQVADFKED